MKSQTKAKEKFQQILAYFEENKETFPHFFSKDKELSNTSASWFLGSKFENGAIFRKAILMAIDSNEVYRNQYHPEDPAYISSSHQESPEYLDDIEEFFSELKKLNKALMVSTPFYSYRSLGHMNWETSIPSMIGYFSAMLYNQNNVALEASPATTIMERSVAHDLCNMLGYNVYSKNIKPWGHITCDGSIANIESVWVTRNLKFYPLAFRELIKSNSLLKDAKRLTIPLLGKQQLFIELSDWEILNIPSQIALSLPNLVLSLCKNLSSDELNHLLEPFLIQEIGMTGVYFDLLKDVKQAIIIGPSSAHYSWPKACAISGLGARNFEHIPLDLNARMDYQLLKEKLYYCLENKLPVIEVVAVIGTTEEGAVDPLNKIIALKEELEDKGLVFHLHADAAWGGYFASMQHGNKVENKNLEGYVPNLNLSTYTQIQIEALKHCDTITIDPHKAGYVPYAAGALCYKNSALKNLISFIPSYIDHGSEEPSMGLFGIEGSKPGAAASSVFLSHKVIPPNVNGIGKVLGESLFSAKYFYAQLVTFKHDNFICIPVVLPKNSDTQFVQDHIIGQSNHDIAAQPDAIEWLTNNGQDTTIVSYFFNFKNKDGTVNNSLDAMNYFNNELYEILSIPPGASIDDVRKNPFFITSSEFDEEVYGLDFIHNQQKKAQVLEEDKPLSFLISTIMCPWVTATTEGNFLDVIFKEFNQALTQAYTNTIKQFEENA